MSEVTELIRDRLGVIVTRALDEYGYFSVEERKRSHYETSVSLVLEITSQIEEEELLSVSSFKDTLTRSIFRQDFDQEEVNKMFTLVMSSLYAEVRSSGIVDEVTVSAYKKYEQIISEAIHDYKVLLKKSEPEYLASLPEYGISYKSVFLEKTKSRLLGENRSGNSSNLIRSRIPKKYADVFSERVKSYSDLVAEASQDINSITSDSYAQDTLKQVDKDMLVATFSGEGKKIYQSIESLFYFSEELGGYQGSLIGSVDYQARYYEYLMAMSYGKRLPGGVLSSEFGRFDEIYQLKTTKDRIAGLKFLESLYLTRSGNQYTSPLNPISNKYSNGLSDRYVQVSGQKDLFTLSLESTYVLCLKVGDSVKSLREKEYRKLGDTATHMEALEKVFPPSQDILERSRGVTGAIGSLLTSYRSLYNLTGSAPSLKGLGDKFSRLSSLISDLSDTIRSVGFRPGGYVPSLELTFYEPDKDKIIEDLVKLGFNIREATEIVSVTSFSELLEKFSPITDSQDVISFFRAYDLTKLLYEFGGEEAITQYVNFLYGVDEENSLLRVLEFLTVNRSLASKVTESKYSKLIGYVITLTYAINPSQLSVLDSILKRNNLDLFDSITTLVERGIETVIKDKSQISLLNGMVAQMVVSDNSGYEGQKPEWNRLISESLGNVGPRVKGLYERADGITPTELYSYLNKPSAGSPLGQILNGVRGGRLTSLIRYCNLFGLLFSISPRKNSGQLINLEADQFNLVLDLLDSIDLLSEKLGQFSLILDDYPSGNLSEQNYSDPLIQAQNKEVSALLSVVNGDENFDPDSYKIAESPGIGNSRIPNGLRIDNSLTPEEAVFISAKGRDLGIFTPVNNPDSGSYVRVSISNLLASGMSLSNMDEYIPGSSDPNRTKNYNSDYSLSYSPSPSSSSTAQTSQFSPLESCRKFGNTNCENQEYASSLCSKGFNKSLYPETGYGQNPPFGEGVLIDRPLGDSMAKEIRYNQISPGSPQSYFSSAGLSEYSRSKVFKDSELMCASLKDPFEYSACISMLKCKKFAPPYAGRYHFKFCPKTLHGGRLRP